jgi:hypothetical protein
VPSLQQPYCFAKQTCPWTSDRNVCGLVVIFASKTF